MQQYQKVSFVSTFLLFGLGTVLYATNGDQMIATGTRSMGMGGVSIAMPFGAESGLANPSLLTYVPSNEISGSATLFFPSIKTRTNLDGTYHESASDFYFMPSLQYATHLGGGVYAGLGVWGVAGMGVDFSDAPNRDLSALGSGLMKMQDDLMIMNIAAPLALREGGISLGVAPILQLGMLDIEYDNGHLIRGHPFDKEWDAGIGAVIGLAYDFDNGLILGMKYRSPISMTYNNSGSGEDLTLEQPGEFGVGFSYSYGPHTIGFDYKRIQWGSASGYEHFGWIDQNVYAVGYQYQGKDWALRMGYNHGKSPIDSDRNSGWQDYLNLLGFPATSEDHYTVGASYNVNQRFTLDLAAVYSPEKKSRGTVLEEIPVHIENKHSEFSLTAQVDYRF